jgi:glycosyltransferase involved in cell wall biosynthesis
MAQAARKVVEEKFSAEVCRAQYYRLFDEMLSGEKRRVGAVARAFAPRRKSLKPALTRTASGQGDGRKRRLGVLMADHGNMLGGGPLVIGRVIDGMSPDDWDVCIYVRHGFPCSSMVKDPGRLRVRHFDRQPAAEDAAEIPGARDGNSNASRSLGLAALRHAWRDMSLALRRAWRGVPVALRREVGFLRDSARLRALLLEENPDVLVCLMGPAELAAIVDGLPCRTILIYHCPPPTFKTPKRYTDALKRCYERSHAILTCSNECRRRWECFFGNGTGRVQVVYNGTEIPEEERAGRASLRDELGIAADDLAIGAVGRLAPEKGMDVLVRAFQQIVRSEPRARLVLVGDGPERGNLEKLARTAGVSDRVAFLGWRDDAVRLNAAFDVAAVPSVWDEPFGLVVVEAMAAGIPVVASAVGGIPEIIEPGSTGWLVSPGDPDALADALIAALRDPARREAMGREARRQAGERFSMESCRRKYYEVFEKVLREGRLVNPAN